LLGALLFTRLQIEGVPLYFFNDVFLLHFSLKAAKGILQRLALLKLYFSQPDTPPYATEIPAQGAAFRHSPQNTRQTHKSNVLFAQKVLIS
jgi:hypothetical protein